jgi:NAD(P)-dependent dehydrogenase (short-subunit alcohol dehydrogenase family)
VSMAAAARSVVITGASTGIGAACALHLDTLGFRVFAGVRKQADAETLKSQASPRLVPVSLDVTDTVSIATAAAAVQGAVGPAGLDGLVNNAGIVVPGPLEFLPLNELRRQLEINVVGQVAVTQAFLPQLRAARGRIVNMGSISGRMATPFVGAYAASKFALEALTDALRLELAPWGISVSIIEPGSVATPIWEKTTRIAEGMLAAIPPEAFVLYGPALAAVRKSAEYAERHAVAPEEVAKAVTHALTAAKPRTRYVIGRTAKIQAALSFLVPDRIRDGMVAKAMHLPTEASPAPPKAGEGAWDPR